MKVVVFDYYDEEEDCAGKLKSVTIMDALGQNALSQRSYEYYANDNCRLKSVRYSGPQQYDADRTIYYEYIDVDSIEDVDTVDQQDVAQITEYWYDQDMEILNSPTRTISQTSEWDAQSSSYVTAESVTIYDGAERVIQTTDDNGQSVWYEYDDQGRQTFTVYKWSGDPWVSNKVIYTSIDSSNSSTYTSFTARSCFCCYSQPYN